MIQSFDSEYYGCSGLIRPPKSREKTVKAFPEQYWGALLEQFSRYPMEGRLLISSLWITLQYYSFQSHTPSYADTTSFMMGELRQRNYERTSFYTTWGQKRIPTNRVNWRRFEFRTEYWDWILIKQSQEVLGLEIGDILKVLNDDFNQDIEGGKNNYGLDIADFAVLFHPLILLYGGYGSTFDGEPLGTDMNDRLSWFDKMGFIPLFPTGNERTTIRLPTEDLSVISRWLRNPREENDYTVGRPRKYIDRADGLFERLGRGWFYIEEPGNINIKGKIEDLYPYIDLLSI